MKKVLVLSVLFLGAALFLSNCNVSTANISDVKMCENIDGNQCPEDNPVFSTNTPNIYCSVKVNNAPEGTNVKFSWNYLGEEIVHIDEVTLTVPGGGTNFDMQSSLSIPNNGWPVGNYEVVIDLGTDNSEPTVKKFQVQ